MKNTAKFTISVVLLPALAALMPCTVNAQVDPGGRTPEAKPAAPVGRASNFVWDGGVGGVVKTSTSPPTPPPTVVTGTVAVSSLPPITGTVTVASTPATPVYTVNLGSGRVPYVLFSQFSFQSTQSPIYGSASLANSTSKLFVITNISSAAGMGPTDVLTNCNVDILATGATGGIPALAYQFFQVPTIFSGAVQIGNLVQYTGNAMTLMYLMPGQDAAVNCTRASAPGQTLGPGNLDSVLFNLTGYLEDLPPSAQ